MMLKFETSKPCEESTLPPGAHRLIAVLIVEMFDPEEQRQRDVASDFGVVV